jgi:hypothetical protein
VSQLFDNEPTIQPVWQVIPQFFRYPLKARVLPVLICISVASVLTLIPFLGFFAWLFLWAMLFKMSYEILSSTASGHMDGPPSVTEMSGGIMFKHIGLLLGMGLIYVFAAGFVGSVLFAILFGLFLMLAIPAAMMTLAMTQSLVQAFNPGIWLQIMRTSGAAYLLTSVFLLLMLFSQAQAEALLLPVLGGSMMLLLIISTFITAYFMAASFHLMGYLLYQFHDEFGIEIKDDKGLPGPGRGENPLLTEASALVRDGQSEQAINYLAGEIKRHGAEVEVHDFYRRLLHSQGQRQALVDHGRDYLPTLIHSHEDLPSALAVAEECVKIDPQFRPANPDDIRTLARRAFEQRRHELVLALTSGFSKQHSNHPHLPENYFMAAQSLVEHKGQIDKAVALTRQLLKRFPEHDLAEDMKRFIAGFSDQPRTNHQTAPEAAG